MKPAAPPLTNDLIDAFAASAVAWLAWLAGVVLRLGAPQRSRRLLRLVRGLERAVEHIVFLKAVRRFGPPPARRNRPRAAPAGFRRSGGDMRLFFKCARIRAPLGASVFERIVRLLEALAAPERYIRRFLRRLLNGLHFNHLVACAPPAAARAGRAAPPRAFADSS